jgi:hypothetical protein
MVLQFVGLYQLSYSLAAFVVSAVIAESAPGISSQRVATIGAFLDGRDAYRIMNLSHGFLNSPGDGIRTGKHIDLLVLFSPGNC